MNSKRISLNNNGYFSIPNVLDEWQLTKLRKICDDYYSNSKEKIMPISDFLSIPELAVIPFLPAVVNPLKSVLGDDYVTIPEFTLQTNRFGGWHIDAQSEGFSDYRYQENYLQIQCAIYLQDNLPRKGGGLDVVPKSHLELVKFGSPNSVFRRSLKWAQRKFISSVSIPSTSGELVGFHFHLWHQATQRTVEVPSNKYAIFWVASANTDCVEKYMNHLQERSTSIFQYKALNNLKFPDSYPCEVVNLVNTQNLNVWTKSLIN